MAITSTRSAEFNRPSNGFRNTVCSRYLSSQPSSLRKLTLTYGQLMAGSGDILKSAYDPVDAVLRLRDFHERNILRIGALYKTGQDPITAAAQLADLRKTLAVQAFRLASAEHSGNYALAIGGSVMKGDHTVLTDIDSVVIAAKEEDREAAIKVQGLMSKILDSVYVESDDVMPFHFAGLPIEKLETKFPLVKRSEMTDPFLRSMWLSNGSFFRFLMDLQIVDARGKEKTKYYANMLDHFRDKIIYRDHEAMLDLCDESFSHSVDRSSCPKSSRANDDSKHPFNMKNEAFRPFYYALYAARAKYGIKSPSPWQTLIELEAKGKIGAADKRTAEGSISYLLELRHLIGFAYIYADDSKMLTEEALNVIAYARGWEKADILVKAQEAAAGLRRLAAMILAQLKNDQTL